MKRSAITWLAGTGTNFYISPWGHIWKKHRVEERGMQLSGPQDLFCLLHKRQEWRGSSWNSPLWLFAKERKTLFSVHLLPFCKDAMDHAFCSASSLLGQLPHNLKFILKTAEGFYFSLFLNNGILRNWSISAEQRYTILLEYQRNKYFLFLS